VEKFLWPRKLGKRVGICGQTTEGYGSGITAEGCIVGTGALFGQKGGLDGGENRERSEKGLRLLLLPLKARRGRQDRP